MLLQVLQQHRETIATRAKQRVLLRPGRNQPDSAAQRAIDEVLEQIETVVRSGDGDLHSLATASALRGRELFQEGAAIAQLVLGYGDVRQVISEVASDHDMGISPDDLRLVCGYLDEATALAAMEYLRLQTLAAALKSTEQLGVFTHEVRNQLNTATLALESIQASTTASSRQATAMLERSLRALRELVDRSIQDVRIAAQRTRPELVQVQDLLADLIIPARAEAAERNLRFVVMPLPSDVAVVVDRIAMTSAIANLIQNALKFTRQCSSVTLSVVTTPLRVLIEVGDECGGLPQGRSELLFLPFVQRSEDASGLGLGLVVARRAVEAAGGLLSVRDRPGLGCVFTANLPRAAQAD